MQLVFKIKYTQYYEIKFGQIFRFKDEKDGIHPVVMIKCKNGDLDLGTYEYQEYTDENATRPVTCYNGRLEIEEE